MVPENSSVPTKLHRWTMQWANEIKSTFSSHVSQRFVSILCSSSRFS